EAPLSIDWLRVAQTSWGAVAITVATMILTSADIVLVKHFLSAHETGIYSAASLGGKILLFGVSFSAAILLPKATQQHQRGEKTRHILWGSLVMLAAVSCAGLLVFQFAGGLLLRGLVGRAFLDALPLLTLYGFAMTLLAATGVLASYAIALHRLSFAIPMVVGAVLEIPAIILYHPSAYAVVWVVVATNALVLMLTALGLVYDQFRLREKRL
ncbi:MAG: polysaccharide biosynthesis protein, partial [Vulcanimicrobiaceae bacterium]